MSKRCGVFEVVHVTEESCVFHHDLFSPQAIGAEDEERLLQVVYYRAGVRIDLIGSRGGRVKI